MNVLLIGSGGREHALAWHLAQAEKCAALYCAPGNAGIEECAECVPIASDDIDGIVTFASEKAIDLVVIGPEAPLVAGLADKLRAAKIAVFGPSAAAARLEGSKAFMKDLCRKYEIPTAAYGRFTDPEQACTFIREQGAPIVVKADGLAAGKGVILAQTEDEARAAVQDMLAGNAFGSAGHRVVIEEFLTGEEASFICMIDGEHILPLASSQDHKARDDGDKGPNTGGMGAYSPAPVVTDELHRRILDEVIEPTLQGMAAEGERYTGFLYAGVMVDPQGNPKVLEFNCRFGDPETQPILMRLNSDLAEMIGAAIDGRLDRIDVEWDTRVALGVVLAAGGYPLDYRKGDLITGLDAANSDSSRVFHAGTRRIGDGGVVTDGGRVLCVVGLGADFRRAQENAYRASHKIHFNGIYFRSDIGHRALERR